MSVRRSSIYFDLKIRVGFGMGFFRDRDFLLLARSKNLENPKIPGIGIGVFKIPKFQISGSGFGNLEKARENPKNIPKKFRVENPKNSKSGIGIYFFRDNPGIP